jgi:hypothetical protein
VILADVLSEVLFSENSPIHVTASLTADRFWEFEDAKNDLGLGSESPHFPQGARLA